MRFLAIDKVRPWCNREDAFLTEESFPFVGHQKFSVGRVDISALRPTRIHWFAGELIDLVGHWDEALLWVTDARTWNYENLHLYYRLRTSYGDQSLIEEAPCHFFLKYERADLQSFVELVILNGWSAFLLTSHDYGRCRMSASEYVEIGILYSDELAAGIKAMEKAGVRVDLAT